MKKYLFINKKLFIIAIILLSLAIIGQVYFSFIMKDIIDKIQIKDFVSLKQNTLAYIMYVLLVVILSFLNSMVIFTYIKKIILSIKSDIFEFILKKEIVEFKKYNIGDYISIYDNDIDMIREDYFLNIFYIISNAIGLVIQIIVSFVIHVKLTILVFATCFIIFLFPTIFSNKIGRLRSKLLDSLGMLNSNLKDFFSGFEIIKLYNCQDSIQAKLNKANIEVENKNYNFILANSAINSILGILGFTTILVILVIGSYYVMKQELTIGSLIALIQILNGLIQNVAELSVKISKFQTVKPVVNKINDLLKDNNKNNTLKKLTGFSNTIEFKDVSFSYNENDTVISNINIVFQKGKKYAIIGESGSGKSTIIKLLLKYYNNYNGKITIDDCDLKYIEPEDIYKFITLIPQDNYLFNDSLYYNISLGASYNSDKLNDIIEKYGLKKMVLSSDQSLNMPISENAHNISMGEKQRIGVIRSIMKNSPVVIMDESTSNIDNIMASIIHKDLTEQKDLTVISITHNLKKEILEMYDYIILVKDGEIVEIDNFETGLKKKGEIYNFYLGEAYS